MSDSVVSPAPTPKVGVPLWLLTLITFSGTLAMHIFVPALSYAADDLQASASEMQLTISLYILGLAFGQLIYGPLSDRFGRRPTLIAGLMLYAAAGFGALLAPDAQSLIAARLFQALGGCAGLVLGRAMVRDLAEPQETARRLALLNLMVTAGPTMGPLIGGALAASFGWRAIFVFLCGLGLLNMLLAWRILPETGRGRRGTDLRMLLRNYRQLVVSRAFLGFALGGSCATTAMFSFLAAAPFVFVNQLHRPAHEVGFYLAAMVSGVWLGSGVASRLIPRLGVARVMIRGSLTGMAGALVLLTSVLTGTMSLPLVIGSMFLFTLGAGLVAPTAGSLAVSVNPLVIGSASGLYGFAQFSIGAAAAALGGVGSDPALAAALVLAGAALLAQLGLQVALRAQRRVGAMA